MPFGYITLILQMPDNLSRGKIIYLYVKWMYEKNQI